MFLLPLLDSIQEGRIERILAKRRPRIVVVKQDTQDDLYFCGPHAMPAEIVNSSLMRTGPAGLFAALDAEFLIVPCSAEPECSVWQEKATDLGWYALEDLEALRHQVPNRPHGQAEFAVAVDTIEWARFDIVISIDVAIPRRIVQTTPGTLWCYYIREPKTKSYDLSFGAPIAGYDLFLTQFFSLKELRRPHDHIADVPYYIQYPGWIADLYKDKESQRSSGCFLEHHTGLKISAEQHTQLQQFGPVRSTADHLPSIDQDFYGRSLMGVRERLQLLQDSRYFVQFGRGDRALFGNALIEAICAGCVALGDPASHTHDDVFDKTTTARNWNELLDQLQSFEADPRRYIATKKRQRAIINYTCWTRPVAHLLTKWQQKSKRLQA